MPEQQQTRETRTPANLSTKYDPKLGETNAKRFQAGVIALLKTSDHKGELALAVLEGRADSSKKCLVQFEPRALDYKKVCEILKTTGAFLSKKRELGPSTRKGWARLAQ